MTNPIRFSLVAVMAGALAGCGGANDYKPVAGSAPEQIFAEACASCHGEKGSGKFGFLLKIAGSDHEVAEIAGKIAEGGMVMPSFPEIGEAERAALATYIKAQ
ncbi:c-type cytochrome [Candidatus Endoriftia persephone]|uniref:Cytochrome c, class I n=3 Tax=Gammaproteobacteria TaxID=1236 RepID=G2FC38_9GAMM|nr:cytochrome c [Candidatus Endoriftia persephone]EGW55612.1 cytochrome c, class I [endosymbiont of Tevnia jerichonana (vent Tica)]USF86756.1 cytochrome c [Candidatus Endoriftia persephone]